jgi:hypothetical protein
MFWATTQPLGRVESAGRLFADCAGLEFIEIAAWAAAEAREEEFCPRPVAEPLFAKDVEVGFEADSGLGLIPPERTSGCAEFSGKDLLLAGGTGGLFRESDDVLPNRSTVLASLTLKRLVESGLG